MKTLLLPLLLLVPAARAQVTDATPGWFPFPIPAFAREGSRVDLSALNPGPAGSRGFLRAKGERIVDERGDRERWFGVNIVSEACFPEERDAPGIAGHLASMGVNVVRFHFLDTPWGKISLLKSPTSREWNPEAFARWDRLVAELQKRGIYANINLHVGRTYEGDPKVGPSFSKGLDNFWPAYVEELKWYTSGLLNHVNPHTGRAYKDDPGVGIIEINNENSLVLQPWWLERLPEPFRGELETRWCAFARGKHGTTAALRGAWGVNEGRTGPGLLENPDFRDQHRGWTLDNPNPELSTLEPAKEGIGARWTILKKGAADWTHQLNARNRTLEDGKRYRLSFRMRADREGRRPYVYTSLQDDPWTQTGLYADFEIGAAWKDFRMEFTARGCVPGKVRLTFSARNETGWMEIAGVQLVEIPPGFLPPDATLESGRLPLPVANDNKRVRRDFFEFLAGVELAYAREMRAFIKDEVGAKSMVAHSQVLFGGMLGARREALVSDVVDTHGYWHHPSFPRRQWDMNDWDITNVSQIADRSGGTLGEMAAQRPEGKPYSISEYDHPAPNDFLGEAAALYGAYGSFQDWDALYFYNYAEDEGSYAGTDRIQKFFRILGHPAKHAMLPVAAAIFRQGLVPAAQPRTVLTLGTPQLLDNATELNGNLWANWRGFYQKAGADTSLPLTTRTLVRIREESIPSPSLHADTIEKSVPSPVRWQPGTGLFLCSAPGARLALGKTSGQTHELGDVRFTVHDREGDPQAHLALVTLDGRPVKESRNLLLCALRRAENPNMRWNDKRNSVGNGWGDAPALVLGVSADITLPAAFTVEALDPSGRPKAVVARDATAFAISPADATVWYHLSR